MVILYGFEEDFAQTHGSNIHGHGGQATRALDNGVGIPIRSDNQLAATRPDLTDARDFKVVFRWIGGETQRDPAILLPHFVQRKIGNHPAVIDDADVIGNSFHLRNLM